MKALEIAGLLKKKSPVHYACDWDNVGMHIGHDDKEITKILLTVDVDDEAVRTAIKENADMIVSHHPFIFRGIKQINDDSPLGRNVMTLIENGINVFCMHTNYDVMGGMGAAAADRLGMKTTGPVDEVCDGEGIGRIGELPKTFTIGELCGVIKEKFGLDKVVLYGDENASAHVAAICPGSGKEYIDKVISMGAQVYITGDVTYHCGIEGAQKGLNIIDAGHYGIEHIFIDEISKFLSDNVSGVQIIKMPLNDPRKFI